MGDRGPLTIRRSYKFIGRETVLGQDRYIWQSKQRLPNDSRVEQLTCGVEWFWNSVRK